MISPQVSALLFATSADSLVGFESEGSLETSIPFHFISFHLSTFLRRLETKREPRP